MNFYFGDKSTFFFSATVLPFTRLRVSIRWHTIRHHSLRFAHMHNFRRHSLLTYTVYVYGPVNSHIYFISISNDITKCIVQLLCDAHNTLVTLRLATCNNQKKCFCIIAFSRIYCVWAQKRANRLIQESQKAFNYDYCWLRLAHTVTCHIRPQPRNKRSFLVATRNVARRHKQTHSLQNWHGIYACECKKGDRLFFAPVESLISFGEIFRNVSLRIERIVEVSIVMAEEMRVCVRWLCNGSLCFHPSMAENIWKYSIQRIFDENLSNRASECQSHFSHAITTQHKQHFKPTNDSV